MKKILTLILLQALALGVYAQVLVIPDIHGRTFWKEAVKECSSMPVVFLGDYLDPYGAEGITNEEALANFMDILDYKKANAERVTLLLGNHELHYLNMKKHFSRKDTVNAEQIRSILYENISLFRMAATTVCGGRTFLFTHAGVLKSWWMKHFADESCNADAVCAALNAKLKDEATIVSFINDALMDASKIRGGKDKVGSCMWADVHEHNGKTGFPADVYQVFGHSQLKTKAKIKKNYADLDCRQAFVITKDGNIVPLKAF